jgi:very-short-patch-repair endonuclease
MTPSEKELWKLLRAIDGAHFRKQPAVGKYVYDFGWYAVRLLVELDGGVHELPEVQERDKAKTIHAALNGFRLLRFTNTDVWKRPNWVIAEVRAALNSVTDDASARPPPLTPPHKGAGDEEPQHEIGVACRFDGAGHQLFGRS